MKQDIKQTGMECERNNVLEGMQSSTKRLVLRNKYRFTDSGRSDKAVKQFPIFDGCSTISGENKRRVEQRNTEVRQRVSVFNKCVTYEQETSNKANKNE